MPRRAAARHYDRGVGLHEIQRLLTGARNLTGWVAGASGMELSRLGTE